MKIKEGVRVHGFQAPILIALMAWQDICRKHSIEARITGGLEGKHSPGSLHYVGLACDVSRHEFDAVNKLQTAVTELRVNLNGTEMPGDGDYDIVIEASHVHIEFQPKKEYTP